MKVKIMLGALLLAMSMGWSVRAGGTDGNDDVWDDPILVNTVASSGVQGPKNPTTTARNESDWYAWHLAAHDEVMKAVRNFNQSGENPVKLGGFADKRSDKPRYYQAYKIGCVRPEYVMKSISEKDARKKLKKINK